jgi:hypothetical protein
MRCLLATMPFKTASLPVLLAITVLQLNLPGKLNISFLDAI